MADKYERTAGGLLLPRGETPKATLPNDYTMQPAGLQALSHYHACIMRTFIADERRDGQELENTQAMHDYQYENESNPHQLQTTIAKVHGTTVEEMMRWLDYYDRECFAQGKPRLPDKYRKFN